MTGSRIEAPVAKSDGLGPQDLTGGVRHQVRLEVVGLLSLVLLAALYWVIAGNLVWQWWDDDNYSHGFIVPLFSGFLVWQRREQLDALVPNGRWFGFPVLLLGVGMLILGEVGAELFLARSSLIVILAGLVLLHLGTAFFRLLAFPLAFLVFMVPLPATVFYAVASPLQSLAARNAASVLDLLGVPVLLDGNVIHLSQITLGVTEACSGIRSLISLLALAVAWAALTIPGIWGKSLLVMATVPITVVANAGRVVATGLVGQWFGVEYARGFFHTFSGWLVFLLAFACFVAVHGLIRLVQRHRAPVMR
jgi:exosortase